MSLNKPIWKLRDWINIENLYLDMLSYNKNAVDFHCKSKLKFDKNIFDYLENPDKINWYYLSFNKNAIKLIEENLDKINWEYLSLNKNAIHILEKNLDKINWENLSLNKNAIHLLERNLDKIDWDNLSKNKNAIHILEKYPEKINWYNLSKNKNAIELLKANQDKIDWYKISSNPSIFELDYVKMKENNQDMYGDLITEVMKPSRVFKYMDYDYLEELFGD